MVGIPQVARCAESAHWPMGLFGVHLQIETTQIWAGSGQPYAQRRDIHREECLSRHGALQLRYFSEPTSDPDEGVMPVPPTVIIHPCRW